MAYRVGRRTATQRDALREYTGVLSDWLRARWSLPPTLTEAERAKLCVVYQFDVNARVQIIFVRREPVRSSGDPRFDESARLLLEKTMADGTPLPRPPTSVAPEEFLTVRVAMRLGPDARCG